MKTAREIYDNNASYGWYNYQPMLDEFGTILLQEEDEDYQGDTFLIYKDNNKYGYLNFGWGSCNGCDALQACITLNEVQELMDSLYVGILWFDSIEELKNYFKNKDWDLTWEFQSKAFKEFYPKVMEL